MLGVDRRAPARFAAPKRAGTPELDISGIESLLGEQLESLKAMFADRRQDSVQKNFTYAVFRALNLMEPPRLPTEFGMSRLALPDRLVTWILRRMALTSSPSPAARALIGMALALLD